MKKLSIEEKAKRYDEAIEELRGLLEGIHEEKCEILEEDIIDIFPELKESEDERIRKEIIEAFKTLGDGKIPVVINYADIFTWLEKQGELVNSLSKGLDNAHERIDELIQKNNELCIKLEKQGEQGSLNINQECLKGIKRVQEYQDLSDWEKEFDNIASMYAHNKNQEGYNDSWYVKERAAEMLYYAKKELEKQDEQKSTLRERYKNIAESEWFKKTHEGMSVSDDEKVDNVNKIESKFKVGDYIERKDGLGCHAKVIYIGKNVYGCEKLICPKNSSHFFELMFENQDEFRISSDFQQKPVEYNEENEHRIKLLEALCEDKLFESVPNSTTYEEMKITIDWLKSLKSQNHWKPSDEQMEALWNTLHPDDPYYVDLSSLYNDLKKLT